MYMHSKPAGSGMRAKDKTWILSTVSTAGLIVLMLIYLIMTLWSSNQLSGHMEVISDHPFEVVAAAGDLKTCISEMRIRFERLTSHNSAADITLVRNALDDIDSKMTQPLDKLETLYLGDPEDVARLV